MRAPTSPARTDSTALAMKSNGKPRLRQSLGKQDVDNTLRKLSFKNRSEAGRIANFTRKISDIYKNPQLYAGLWQKELSQWSFPRTCLQVVPVSAATQFCAVFAAIFSFPSLTMLGMTRETATLPFLISGIFGVLCIILFRALLNRFYNRSGKYVIIVTAFLAYLSIGAILLIIANIKLSLTVSVGPVKFPSHSDNKINATVLVYHNISSISKIDGLPSLSNSDTQQTFQSSFEPHTVAFIPSVSAEASIVSKVLTFAGFAILGTAVGSGQYLLQAVALSRVHAERHQIVVTTATLASAGGGCLISIISSAYLTWPGKTSILQLVLSSGIVLSAVSLVLLVLSAGCFILAWRLDILDARQNIKNYSVAPVRPQRTSRSPKEVFDECAHLLGHHSPSMPRAPYHNRTPKYYDPSLQTFVPRRPSTESLGHHMGFSEVGKEEKYAQERQSRKSLRKSRSYSLDMHETLSAASMESQLTMAFDDSAGLMVSSEILKKYNYAIPRVKNNSNQRARGKTTKFSSSSEIMRILLILLLYLALSSSNVSFEFSASTFLTSFIEEKISGNITCCIDTAVRQGSNRLLLFYVMFAASLVFYCKFQDRIDWKKLTLFLCLVTSLLTLLLAVLRETPSLFLPTAFSHGLLKMMIVHIPHLLMLQTLRAQRRHQTEKQRMLLLEGLGCVTWCILPVSLALCGLATGPLPYVTGREETPIIYSAVCGFLACLGLIAIM